MKSIKKVPIQIYLEPKQNRVLAHLSKTKRKSKAAIIRLCINNYINQIPLEEDTALKIMCLGASGKKDISKRHDDYITSFHK